jgi:hypothetical protein
MLHLLVYSYLPSSSTYARLMYTVQTIVSQGMYVMLDYQPMVRLHLVVGFLVNTNAILCL